MARNRNAGKSTGKSKSAKYFAKNPKARAKKNAYQKKYNARASEKKRRAELNKYNREKGTYGNGDKKDASHRNGKIVGMEKQSTNRARNGTGSTNRSRKTKKKYNPKEVTKPYKKRKAGVNRNSAGKKVRVGGGKTVKGPKMVNLKTKKATQSKGVGNTGPAPKSTSRTTTKKMTPKKFKEEYGKKAYKGAKKAGLVKRSTSTKGKTRKSGNKRY